MALKIRRGQNAQRGTRTFAAGEIIWTTDGQKLYVGDGVTPGGIDIAAQLGGNGITYNQTSGKLDINLGGTNTDTLAEGNNNLYFTVERGQDAAGGALVAGNAYNTGITFTYDDVNNRITAAVSAGLGLPPQGGQGGKFLQTNGSALQWTSVQTSVSSDPSPTLGGSLTLSGHDITGSGNININGSVTTHSITLTGANVITTTDPTPITVRNDDQDIFRVIGTTTDGTLGKTPQLNLYSSRGSVSSPTNNQAGDHVMVVNFGGYHGSAYQQIASIVSAYDPTATMTDSNPASGLGFVTNNNSGGVNIATFDYRGVFAVPTLAAGDGTASNPSIVFTTDASQDTGFFHPADGVVCVAINAQEKARFDSGGLRVGGFVKVAQVSGTLPSPAEAGMIVLDGTTFKGYNGSGWVNLN